ncbi:hypothetical protein DFH09DRAFT_1285389 [Mycena vulgaris]|nr:hypothetical protein DFH09DRAFT_1285389 [Mycena vulgaris]
MHQNSLFVTSADGTQIFAEARGDPPNPCIGFIHGLSMDMGCFDDIFADPLWNARVLMVRYDVRGHGMSPMDAENSVRWESARFAEDFDAVISHFQVTRPFVAGWYMRSPWIQVVTPNSHIFTGAWGCRHAYAATIPVDILTVHDPTYLAGYPDVVRPEAVDCIPGLTSVTGVALFKSTATKFVDSFTSKPMDYSTRFLIMGAMLSQPGKAVGLAMSRPQDPSILFEVAAKKIAAPPHARRTRQGDVQREAQGGLRKGVCFWTAMIKCAGESCVLLRDDERGGRASPCRQQDAFCVGQNHRLIHPTELPHGKEKSEVRLILQLEPNTQGGAARDPRVVRDLLAAVLGWKLHGITGVMLDPSLNPGRKETTYVVNDPVEPRGVPSKAPIIAGVLSALLLLLLRQFVPWHKKKRARDVLAFPSQFLAFAGIYRLFPKATE